MTSPAPAPAKADKTNIKAAVEAGISPTIHKLGARIRQLEAENATLIAAHAAEIQAREAAEAGWRDAVANGEAYRDQAITTEALADRLAAENAALVKALRPFAFGDPTMERILFDGMPDDAPGTFTIKLGDIRAARAALPEAITPKETSDGQA